jgi:hypothetical protein
MRVYAKTEKKENGFEMVEDWASQVIRAITKSLVTP